MKFLTNIILLVLVSSCFKTELRNSAAIMSESGYLEMKLEFDNLNGVGPFFMGAEAVITGSVPSVPKIESSSNWCSGEIIVSSGGSIDTFTLHYGANSDTTTTGNESKNLSNSINSGDIIYYAITCSAACTGGHGEAILRLKKNCN